MRQRGFTLYIVLAALLAFAGMGIALKVQTSRLASCQQASAAFVAQIKANGEAAEKEAKRVNAENDAKKAKYDKEIIKLRADRDALAKRLRDSAATSNLPETRTVTGKPDGTACFDRGILDGAIRAFTAGTAAIATEGQSAADELSNARAWAANR